MPNSRAARFGISGSEPSPEIPNLKVHNQRHTAQLRAGCPLENQEKMMTEITMENQVENQAVDIGLIELADFFFEHMGKPATANDILKECPEVKTRKRLFKLLEDLAHENLVQSSKEGTKDGHALNSWTWWINDDQYAYELWKRYLRDA